MAAPAALPMWEDIPEEVGMMDPQEYWEEYEDECGVEAPNEEGMGDESWEDGREEHPEEDEGVKTIGIGLEVQSLQEWIHQQHHQQAEEEVGGQWRVFLPDYAKNTEEVEWAHLPWPHLQSGFNPLLPEEHWTRGLWMALTCESFQQSTWSKLMNGPTWWGTPRTRRPKPPRAFWILRWASSLATAGVKPELLLALPGIPEDNEGDQEDGPPDQEDVDSLTKLLGEANTLLRNAMKILKAAEAALQAAAPGAKWVIQNMLEQLIGELESLEDISSILSKGRQI